MSAYSTWRIDLYWKKLDLVAITQKQKVELSCQPKFELIAKQFNKSSIEIQLDILKKIKGDGQSWAYFAFRSKDEDKNMRSTIYQS